MREGSQDDKYHQHDQLLNSESFAPSYFRKYLNGLALFT